MNFDELINSTLKSKVTNKEIADDKGEDMFSAICLQVDKKNSSFLAKILSYIKDKIIVLHLKECIEVALFIFILVAIPLGVNHFRVKVVKNKAVAEQKSSLDTKEFIAEMTKLGCQIKTDTSNVKKMGGGQLTIIDVNGEGIGIFECANIEDTKQYAMFVDKEDSKELAAAPHYYRKGNIIVGYTGDNKELIKNIEHIMGNECVYNDKEAKDFVSWSMKNSITIPEELKQKYAKAVPGNLVFVKDITPAKPGYVNSDYYLVPLLENNKTIGVCSVQVSGGELSIGMISEYKDYPNSVFNKDVNDIFDKALKEKGAKIKSYRLVYDLDFNDNICISQLDPLYELETTDGQILYYSNRDCFIDKAKLASDNNSNNQKLGR